MAYGRKFTISYKRLSNSTTTIDILERDYSGSVTELTPAADPLKINFIGDAEKIFDSSIGSGATICVYAPTLTLTSLYTEDPLKYMVKIYNGTYSGGTLAWQGYLNTGIYTEDYSTSSALGTAITLMANDGMAVLDVIPYLNTDGSNYEGVTTIATVLKRILDKLGLTFTDVIYNGNISLLPNGLATNVFLYTSVYNGNYIDEGGKEMKCREVLNAITSVLGVTASFKADKFYLLDLINLHSTSNGKKHSRVHFGYVSTHSVGGYLDISTSAIKWFETGAMLDVTPTFNQVKVKFDPYIFTGFNYSFKDSGNHILTNNNYNWTSRGSFYYPAGLTGFKGWTVTTPNSAYIFADGHKETTTSSPMYFITTVPNLAIGDYYLSYFSYRPANSPASYDDVSAIKVLFSVYVSTNGYDFDNIVGRSNLTSFVVKYGLKVGDYYKQNGTNTWSLIKDELNITVLPLEGQTYMNDQWIEVSAIVALTRANVDVLSGNITVDIIKPSSSLADYVFIKEVKVEIVKYSDEKPISNSGTEVEGKELNATTTKSPVNIDLVHGISTVGSSRGGLRNSQTGLLLKGFYRDITDESRYDSANLILQNVISQYYKPRYRITGTLNAVTYRTLLPLYLIKDSTYMSTRGFYIVSGTYKDKDESFEVDLIELESTRADVEGGFIPAATLYIIPSSAGFYEAGTPKGDNSITVNSNLTWTCERSATWITCSKYGDIAGVSDVTITVSNNTGGLERTGNVTFKIGSTIMRTCTITQDGDHLRVTPEFLTFDDDGVPYTNDDIVIDTTESWTITCSEAWITVDDYSGTGSQTINVIIAPNTNPDVRQGHVKISATGFADEYVYIYQDGFSNLSW